MREKNVVDLCAYPFFGIRKDVSKTIEHIEIFLNDYEKVFDVFNSHKGILMDAENFKRTQINEVVISHENKIDNGVMTTYDWRCNAGSNYQPFCFNAAFDYKYTNAKHHH